MKGSDGKAPAIQWYYKDWLADKRLQRASATSRGIWMNLLMHMVDCSVSGGECDDGTLTDLTIAEIVNLGSCTEDQAWEFVEDAFKHLFCDIEADRSATFHITSRRLSRDSLNRRKWREQKRIQRMKGQESDDVRPDVPGSSKDVHAKSPLSPIPSPTPTSKRGKKIPPQNDKKKRTRVDNVTLTPELKQLAIDKGIPLQRATIVFEKFWNHHKGKGSLMSDWTAAWRSWLIKEVEWNGSENVTTKNFSLKDPVLIEADNMLKIGITDFMNWCAGYGYDWRDIKHKLEEAKK